MRAAARAGLLPPSRWDALSAEDKAEVLEWDLAERLMEQYEVTDAERQAQRQRNRR